MEDKLRKRLEAGVGLPTPPAVVVRLLELTRRPDVSAKEVTEAVAVDPGLSAKILRFVNSPLAGVREQVTSLQQAVALVGIRGVKMLALSFSVLSIPRARRCRGFDPTQFALQSLVCGAAAKVLSETTRRGSPQEAFLTGLLSQIGRSTLAAALPDEYAKVLAAARFVPTDLPDLERAALGGAYPEVGAWLMRNWGIPDSLCSAIRAFRDLHETSDATELAEILHVAESLASAVVPDGQREPAGTQTFVDEAQRHVGLTVEQCLTVIPEIVAQVEDARSLLDLPPGRIRPIEHIETEVRERLAELSVAMHLENQGMAVRQEELIRRATTDALTGIGNRAAFDARLSLELERSARCGTSFALLMIDVDRFKNLNDTFGHQAGDRVLQTVAHVLDENIRKVDYVARYGGEEFAVIAPGVSDDGLVFFAERLRRSVEAASVPWDGHRLSVTISIGVAVFRDTADGGDAASVIRAADAQLYAAKCDGRNRVAVARDRIAPPHRAHGMAAVGTSDNH